MIDTQFEQLMNAHTLAKSPRIDAYVCGIIGHAVVTQMVVGIGTPHPTMTCRHCVDNGVYNRIAHGHQIMRTEGSTPTHEWYSPERPELIADPATRQHCMGGGLLLREIPPKTVLPFKKLLHQN